MALTQDKHIDPNSLLVRRMLNWALNPAQSLTNAVIRAWRVPHNIKVLGAQLFARTYTATGAFRLYKAAATEVIIGPTLAIDATAEAFKLVTKTVVALIDGVTVVKAPATAITFTAAHTVNTAGAAGTGHWGAILVQMNAAGTVSTKVVSADQDYATEALAIAALPAPDASKVQLGYITIQVKTGGNDWVANTDDMTAASDVTAANFYSTADSTRTITGSTAPVAASSVEAVMTTAAGVDVTEDEYLVLLCTTDGTYVAADALLTIDYRAKGYRNGR